MNDTAQPNRKRRRVGAIVQAVGFALGIALLGYCVSLALSADNRQQLTRLSDASAGQILALLGLSAASVAVNGAIFWTVLFPVRRLKLADVIAVNALATFLAYLPFKLSVVARVVVHNRRDGVPLVTMGAWILAVACVLLTTLGPVLTVSVWRRGVDAWWWTAGLTGIVVATAFMLAAARWFAGERGMKRLHAIADWLPTGVFGRAARSERFEQAHAGAAMLAHPWSVTFASVLRLADAGGLAVRFAIAGAILGVDLPWTDAILLGATYFVLGVVSPFGMLGAREGGTLGLAALVGIAAAQQGADGSSPLPVLILFVTGIESVVHIAGGGFAVAWLRADRLLRGRAAERAERGPV
ncbi:MAG: hypothetical protein RIB60_09545 [Phycisphaerales bacterium]